VRSSAAGVITVALKKCGPGSLRVKTTPAYAKGVKQELSSISSLTVRLSPDGEGNVLLRKKQHPRVMIQLVLIATSGPQPGFVVTHTRTVTIGVNGSRHTEEKAAAGQQAKEEAKAAREAEAAAAGKQAYEEAATKKKAEVAADEAAATRDQAKAAADKTAATNDEHEAPQLLSEAKEREGEEESYSQRSFESEGEAIMAEKRTEEERGKIEGNREAAESERSTAAKDLKGAERYEGLAAEAEDAAQEAYLSCNPEEPCPQAESYEKLAQTDFSVVNSFRAEASIEDKAAGNHENEMGIEETAAATAKQETTTAEGLAKAAGETAKSDGAAANNDRTEAGEKEHEAPALKQLAEQKELEAAAEGHAAEVAKKA
jgi:hypothetical protein